MRKQIKVFGQDAEKIKAGVIFVPSFDQSSEGRKIVTLNPNDTLSTILDQYDHMEIGLDEIIGAVRAICSGDPK